jgi:hypothetical protein
MRSIFVGIEYAGKTTLINLLQAYYRQRRRPTHNDDHFTIPDATLSPESRAQMIHFPNDVKERMQRMQIHYHIEVIRNYPNTLISGWHIEEAVYSALYGNDPDHPYYPNYHYTFQRHYEVMVLEARLPDVVMFHLTASDDAIRERMRTAPHEYQIIREKDIAEVKRRFEEEVANSLFTRGGRVVTLDTTDRRPEESLDELLLKSEPLVTDGELAMRAMAVPNGDYEVRYENGVRTMILR